MSTLQIGQITSEWAKSQKIPFVYHHTIASTNDVAKEQAFNEDILETDFFLYLSDLQTNGRGRFDRQWINETKGTALISSWSFFIPKAPTPLFTAKAGLALYKASVATWPFLNWSLKAPNDLYINDKKIAGLLVETVSQGSEHRLIIGLGLNVLSFPQQVETATSLVHSLANNFSNLNSKVPLEGADWISFCERLLFEITLSVGSSSENLSYSEAEALRLALNLNPLLEKKYEEIPLNGGRLWL